MYTCDMYTYTYTCTSIKCVCMYVCVWCACVRPEIPCGHEPSLWPKVRVSVQCVRGRACARVCT